MLGRVCGIDFGVLTYAVVSDGTRYEVTGKKNRRNMTAVRLELERHIAANYDIVIIEHLNGSSLTAKSIARFESGIRLRHKRLIVIRADASFPSSRMCSACGKVGPRLKLDRVFSCECGHTEDRDLNAAKNLANWKTKLLRWEDDD